MAKGKLKSNIPWTNYAMRKHGASIKMSVGQLGVKVNANMLKHHALKVVAEQQKAVKELEAPVWASTTMGTC
jgi:hypothetical protein